MGGANSCKSGVTEEELVVNNDALKGFGIRSHTGFPPTSGLPPGGRNGRTDGHSRFRPPLTSMEVREWKAESAQREREAAAQWEPEAESAQRHRELMAQWEASLAEKEDAINDQEEKDIDCDDGQMLAERPPLVSSFLLVREDNANAPSAPFEESATTSFISSHIPDDAKCSSIDASSEARLHNIRAGPAQTSLPSTKEPLNSDMEPATRSALNALGAVSHAQPQGQRDAGSESGRGGAVAGLPAARSRHTASAVAAVPRGSALADRLAQQAEMTPGYSLVDAKLKVKEWQWQLKMEMKHMEREIKHVKSDELKLQRKIRLEAEKGNVQHLQQLARSVVRSRQVVAQLEKTKFQMQDIHLQLTSYVATMTMKHAMRASVDALQVMNGEATVGGMATAMEHFKQEMARSAHVDESIEDAFRNDEDDDEAALEVQRVLEDLELDKLKLLASTRPSWQSDVAAIATFPRQQVASERY